MDVEGSGRPFEGWKYHYNTIALSLFPHVRIAPFKFDVKISNGINREPSPTPDQQSVPSESGQGSELHDHGQKEVTTRGGPVWGSRLTA